MYLYNYDDDDVGLAARLFASVSVYLRQSDQRSLKLAAITIADDVCKMYFPFHDCYALRVVD